MAAAAASAGGEAAGRAAKKAGTVNSGGLRRHNIQSMISLTLALAASLMAPPAGAVPDPNVEQIELRVDYGDLDLGTAAGKAEFLRRMRHAQSSACDREPGPKTQSAWRQVFACKERARVEASRAIERANEAVAVASNSRTAPDL